MREWLGLMILLQGHHFLVVCSWTRHLSFFSQLPILEPLVLGLKVTCFLDYLNISLFDTLALKMPSLGHLLINLIKALSDLILARTWHIILVL